MRRRLSVLEPSCGRAELSDAVVSQQLSSRDCPLIWGCSLCASLTRRHAWAIARESRAENKSGYWLSAVRPPKRKRSARRRHRPLCTVHSLIFLPCGTMDLYNQYRNMYSALTSGSGKVKENPRTDLGL